MCIRDSDNPYPDTNANSDRIDNRDGDIHANVHAHLHANSIDNPYPDTNANSDCDENDNRHIHGVPIRYRDDEPHGFKYPHAYSNP